VLPGELQQGHKPRHSLGRRGPQQTYCVNASDYIAGRNSCLRVDQLPDSSLVTEQVQCLFQTFEVIRTDKYRRWTTFTSHDDTLVFGLNAIDEL
jgi:hypothetical protein